MRETPHEETEDKMTNTAREPDRTQPGRERMITYTWYASGAAPEVGDGPVDAVQLTVMHLARKGYTASLQPVTAERTPYGETTGFWMFDGKRRQLPLEPVARYSAKTFAAYAENALALVTSGFVALAPEAEAVDA